MKIKGDNLEFLYRIKSTGESVPFDGTPMMNEIFDCRRLSLSEETWIAKSFFTYVVKVKKMPMTLTEAISTMEKHQQWRIGNIDGQIEPRKITEALNIVLEHAKKQK